MNFLLIIASITLFFTTTIVSTSTLSSGFTRNGLIVIKKEGGFQYLEGNLTRLVKENVPQDVGWCADNCEWCCCEGSPQDSECWDCDDMGCYDLHWDCPDKDHNNERCVQNNTNICNCGGINQTIAVNLTANFSTGFIELICGNQSQTNNQTQINTQTQTCSSSNSSSDLAAACACSTNLLSCIDTASSNCVTSCIGTGANGSTCFVCFGQQIAACSATAVSCVEAACGVGEEQPPPNPPFRTNIVIP